MQARVWGTAAIETGSLRASFPGGGSLSATRRSDPLVTILIPAFEAASYVADAVGSALAQRYTRLEVIVAPDDGQSYDRLRARFADSRLRILAPGAAVGSGPGAARNRAIDAATGDFFTMLDADDRIEANYVEDLMQRAEREGAALATTRHLSWDQSRIVRALPIGISSLTLAGYGRLLASMHPLLHRSLEVGYCDGFAEDVVHDAFVIARCGVIRVVESAVYQARQREGSLSRSGPAAEQRIQQSYRDRIEQIRDRPTELGLQVLDAQSRDEFVELFRFRDFVSRLFARATPPGHDYHAWVAGKEAALWERFCAASPCRRAGADL